jgi:hypothetical protein
VILETKMTSKTTPQNIKKLKNLLNISNNQYPTTNNNTWTETQLSIENLLWDICPFDDPPKHERLNMFSSGIFDVLIPMISAPSGKYTDSCLEAAWTILSCAMLASDIQEQDNIETLKLGIDKHLIDLAMKELSYEPLRYNGRLLDRAFICLSSPALYNEFVPLVIRCGAPQACLKILQRGGGGGGGGGDLQDSTTCSIIDWSLRFCNNVAGHQVDAIRNLPGLVEVVQPYLRLLTGEDDSMIMIGFIAAKLLIRISPTTTTTTTTSLELQQQLLQLNNDDIPFLSKNIPIHIILKFYVKLMRKVMNSGKTNRYCVYNTYMRIAGFALDLSLLAQSFSISNKQLLIPICPLLIEMITFHHNNDRDVIHFGLIFLSQVILNDGCLLAVKEHLDWLQQIQHIVLSEMTFNKETIVLLNQIMSSVC